TRRALGAQARTACTRHGFSVQSGRKGIMPGSEVAVNSVAPRRRRSWLRVLLYGAAAGLLLAGAGEAGRVVLGRNFHVVVPGQIYRCAQLNGATLERFIQAHGIRTVVTLRGFSPDFPWYCRECRVTHRLDVNQEDIAFSAARLPAVGEVRRLIEVLDH